MRQWHTVGSSRHGDICQSSDGEVLLPPGMLESILEQNSPIHHLGNELRLLKDKIYSKFRKEAAPIYDPDSFRQLCIASGAPNIFSSIYQMMSSPRRNAKRNKDIEKLTVNIIYTLCYGLSQKCNFMQKDLSLFLMSENLNRPALDTARKLGVTCTGTTGRSHMCNTVAAYEHEIDEVINILLFTVIH